MCTLKLTRVTLIYCTEPTTKKWKAEELKSEQRLTVRRGIREVSREEEKERLW